MTTTPDPQPGPQDHVPDDAGAELGLSPDNGSSFEPEEDPEGDR